MKKLSVHTIFVLSVALLVGASFAGAADAGTASFDEAMHPILSHYLRIQQALAGDSTSGVQAAARSIAALAEKLDATSVTGEHAEHYKHLPMKFKKATMALSKTTKLEKTREAFKKLSMPLAMWGTMSKPIGIDVVFCSMAKGSWLQKTGPVMNPYYGKSMLHCGEVVGGAAHAAKAGGH